MVRRLRWGIVLVAACGALVGCGGDSDKQATTKAAIAEPAEVPAAGGDEEALNVRSNFAATNLKEGWCDSWSVTLRPRDGGSGANVIASAERAPEGIGDAQELMRNQDIEYPKEFPKYQQLDLRQAGAFGRTGYRREFTWSPPDSEAVRQVQLTAVTQGWVFTATGTVAEVDAEDGVAEIDAVLKTFRTLGTFPDRGC